MDWGRPGENRSTALVASWLGFVLKLGFVLNRIRLAVGRRAYGVILLLFLTGSLQAQDTNSAQAAADDATAAVLEALQNRVQDAISRAEQSVVAIARVPINRRPNDRRRLGGLELDLPLMPDDPTTDPNFVPTFFGSGVILSEDGTIVTCGHVLDDPRENRYYVWLDRRGYRAEVMGLQAQVLASDPFSDLAILKIDADSLTPMRLGNAETLRKGQFAIALGNPDAIARDGQASATWGIISNLKRMAPADDGESGGRKESIHEYGTLIQTDARMVQGSSGGALINLDGEMIGLVTSLIAREGVEHPAGFAIAVDPMFRRIIERLQSGRLPEFGFLGIEPAELPEREQQLGWKGARVSSVIRGLPGEQAGLVPGDVITRVGDEPINNTNDLFRELSKAAAGDSVQLTVARFVLANREPVTRQLSAHMSKKFVATTRPGFAIHAPEKWRGLAVEFATAISSEVTRFALGAVGRKTPPKIAILEVEPGTVAWQAGLRPGNAIVSVNGQRLLSPDEFYEYVNQLEGSVTLAVNRPDGTAAKIVLPPVPPSP